MLELLDVAHEIQRQREHEARQYRMIKALEKAGTLRPNMAIQLLHRCGQWANGVRAQHTINLKRILPNPK